MLDLCASQAAGRIVTANRGVGSVRTESHLYLDRWEAFPLHSWKRIAQLNHSSLHSFSRVAAVVARAVGLAFGPGSVKCRYNRLRKRGLVS